MKNDRFPLTTDIKSGDDRSFVLWELGGPKKPDHATDSFRMSTVLAFHHSLPNLFPILRYCHKIQLIAEMDGGK
jgi:hypothetical protein